MEILNWTASNGINRFDDEVDRLPVSYDENDSTMDFLNRTYYEDILVNEYRTSTTNVTDLPSSLSLLSLSSPFSYIILILAIYFVLTLILLVFSLYKQRRSDFDYFYSGEHEDDSRQSKQRLAWKRLLIGKIRKGDMQPLLSTTITVDPDGTGGQYGGQSSTFLLRAV